MCLSVPLAHQHRVGSTDVDAIVMQQVLAFIYSGKAPSLDKMADELLPAADKVNDTDG